MTVGIVTNSTKDEALAFTREITAYLEIRGVAVRAGQSAEADFWIILGGDGTMLRASHQAAIHRIPMLGINFGNMGFLTDVEKHDGLQAIEKLLQGGNGSAGTIFTCCYRCKTWC